MNVIALSLRIAGSVGVTVGICAILLFCAWRMLYTLQEGTSYVRRLHQIPCSHCAYFTGDYRLKCAVNPISALTEEAIGCGDYVSRSPGCGRVCSQNASPYQPIRELVKR